MRHCTKFKADEVYYLEDNSIYTERKLSIGICPICNKKVAELIEMRFDGVLHKIIKTGVSSDNFVKKYSDEILYSAGECNYKRFKAKPFGWKYGINQTVTRNGISKIKQMACDFYGNKEVIKIV